MSGGVDSTAVALLLKDRLDVQGFFMNLGQPDFETQKHRVERLAGSMGVPLRVIDLRKQFKILVTDYFTSSYFKGKTPNPCMVCNREIKFGLFMQTILSTGMARMATGHYARIDQQADEFTLREGVDGSKDQSYFLARLTQQQLSQILFPLGSMTKRDIYDYVESRGYDDFRGLESQDVCFLKNSSVASFLESNATHSTMSGPIMSTGGAHLGRHIGLHRYTIGQRRGLGLPDSTPWYVCTIDYHNNTLVVGKQQELLANRLSARSAHWLTRSTPLPGDTYRVKIRYSHPGASARFTSVTKDTFTLEFNEPQRSIAPGQYAVLYDGDRVIGSGEIVSDLSVPSINPTDSL